MRMTTRGRYGLRAMLELARCYSGPPVLMSTLARREGISRKYLHALLASLKSAGLVRSVRGAGGGFLLSRAPSEIRLNEILRAVESPLSLVHCVSRPAACKRTKTCTARRVWQELSGTIEEVLRGVTLGDLISKKKASATWNHPAGRRPRSARCVSLSVRRSSGGVRKPRGKK
jgi:Rrf2 family protein